MPPPRNLWVDFQWKSSLDPCFLAFQAVFAHHRFEIRFQRVARAMNTFGGWVAEKPPSPRRDAEKPWKVGPPRSLSRIQLPGYPSEKRNRSPPPSSKRPTDSSEDPKLFPYLAPFPTLPFRSVSFVSPRPMFLEDMQTNFVANENSPQFGACIGAVPSFQSSRATSGGMPRIPPVSKPVISHLSP